MPRLLNNPSLKCISLNVNKTAYEELIERGYDIKDLFDNLLLSLLEIERESDIRYANAKTAIQNLIDEKKKLQLQRMHEEQKAAEYAQRERENKLRYALPLFKYFLRYFGDVSRTYYSDDDVLFRRLIDKHEEISKRQPEFKNVIISKKWTVAIKKYYEQNKEYNPDTINQEITDLLL